jgi:hypothetical protein
MINDRRFRFVKWLLVLWLAVWLPTYSKVWGWANFLHICNVAVLLSCFGFLFESPLLLSSQALISIMGNFLWIIEFSTNLVIGHPLFGGTEYMQNASIPLWVRCLSLYHFVLPLLLLWGLLCLGYDRRGCKLQAAITLLLLFLSRFTNPAKNINFVFLDPLFHKAWGNAFLHVIVIWLGLCVILYWPTHVALCRLFPEPKKF